MSAPSQVQSTVELPIGYEDSPDGAHVRRQRWRRGWTRRRLLSIFGVAVLVAAASFATWDLTRKGSASAATRVSVTTQKVTVSTGTIKQTLSASGTIEPASEADLSFAVSGQVTAVDVSVGQKVTSGQTLATVDSTALQDDVNAANETLSAAESRLSSDQSSGASTSQIDSDQASVTSAESQLATAKQNLADANLISTLSGTVASVSLSVGQQVSAGSSNSGAGAGNTGSGNSLGGLGASSSTSSSSASSGSAQIGDCQIFCVSGRDGHLIV